MAPPVRDLWTSLCAKFNRSGFEQLAEVALRSNAFWRSRRRKRTRSGSTSIFVGSSAPAARNWQIRLSSPG
jgi:hypothetical protein